MTVVIAARGCGESVWGARRPAAALFNSAEDLPRSSLSQDSVVFKSAAELAAEEEAALAAAPGTINAEVERRPPGRFLSLSRSLSLSR